MSVVEKFKSVVKDIKHVPTSSATLLGAPIGGERSIDEMLSVKLLELRRLSSRLSLLGAHDALFLLKNCFSIPKLTYTLRSAPCYERILLSDYGDVLRTSLQLILNIQLTDVAWEQATLPVASGGIGIRKATQVYKLWLAPKILCSDFPSRFGAHKLTLRQFNNAEGMGSAVGDGPGIEGAVSCT